MVYFLESNGAIKIGVTNDPYAGLCGRIKGFQRHEKITVLGITDKGLQRERELHQQFRSYRPFQLITGVISTHG